MKKYLIHIYCWLHVFASFSQNTEAILNTHWQFRKTTDEKWLPAIVPGNVHTDLLNNKQIPDPFFSDNEKKVQWVENENWEYKTYFDCDKKTLSQSHIELKFEGLDTYAKVYLNEKLILDADNMFRSWVVDVKKELKEGNNTLRVVFESAVKRGKAEASKLPYTLPGDEKVFTRKAQYQYGWDWGPRLVTCGIWKPIKLITWNKVKVESIYACTKEIKDSIAKVDFIIETTSDKEDYYDIRYSYSNRRLEQSRVQSQLVIIKKGVTTNTVSCTIPKAKLWWCNGLNNGRAFLYNAGFKITKDDNLVTQTAIEFGIRTVELVREKDSVGTSFFFTLNGVPVFMKGANYIPQHSFLPSLRKQDYRQLLSMALDANMNMLRVWGGGVYADDEFYKDCDKAGILIWQDFMFACAMYPGDKSLLENIKQEAVEQVKKMRNHPCIALWCGNNEIDEGWHNWGWHKEFKYSKKDSATIWTDYKRLFQEIIPEAVKQNDFHTPYWPSSPSIGWGHKESLQEGDSHYWGVWWGNEPFENYEKKVGRFMSEYGFQSMPSIKTIKSFCDSADLNFNSEAIKNHQKHKTGYETITTYMARDFIVPKKLEEFVYTSQLLQEKGMRTAIEAHRRAKPYCMGTLFWQLNDCWPVTSWSCIDFYNRPKAFYYALKNLYADLLISVKEESNSYRVYIISDKPKALKGHLSISLKDFDGKELFKVESDTIIAPNSVSDYFSLNKIQLNQSNLDKTYLRCEFISSDNAVKTKSLFYFVPPKNLNLSLPKPELVFNPATNSIIIKSNTLIKNIFIPGSIEDNFFDIEPGTEYHIKLSQPINNVKELKFLSLNGIND